MSGVVEALFITATKGAVVEQQQSVELIAEAGIAGDRYCKAQPANGVAAVNNLTLIDADHLDAFLAKNTVEISYGDFRRNVITRGIDLNDLVGKEFTIGDVLCKGTELCEPCAPLAAKVHSAILPDLVHKAGIRAEILRGGTVALGAELTLPL